MDKEVEIRFDEDAYKEYEELQKLVAEGKPPKKKPTYEQLLTSINTGSARGIGTIIIFNFLVALTVLTRSNRKVYI